VVTRKNVVISFGIGFCLGRSVEESARGLLGEFEAGFCRLVKGLVDVDGL
jgi:hypothetical protein